MQIKVLGCSGGIGGELRTTALLIDEDILIDAGTGVGDLSMEALLKIDHILITHAHLDHIAFIPLLLDTVMGIRRSSITVHANQATIQTLREHIFNWKVWPDFNAIPSAENPFLKFCEVEEGKTFNILARNFTPLPVNHAVSAVGYQVDSGNASLVFTGDTTVCEALWVAVNQIQNLKYLIIEAAFSNSELALAQVSKHLCPSLLEAELTQLNIQHTQNLKVYITHIKPGEGPSIMKEIAESRLMLDIQMLMKKQVFYL